MLIAVSACSNDGEAEAPRQSTTTALASCDELHKAVVTDIDATLTTSNDEFVMQAQDVTYDQKERPGASELLEGYSDLGYEIVYVTARPASFPFPDTDASARAVTLDWLEAHGFPTDPEEATLYLAPDNDAAADPAPYKEGVIDDLRAQGYEFDFGYGDSDTDFEAFLAAGVGEVFSVGELAGFEGTTAIPGDTYSEHIAEQLGSRDPVCTRD